MRVGLGTLFIGLMAFPFPYIANTAGCASPTVHAGSTLFTIIGFCGLYLVLGLAFLFLVGREVTHGPEAAHAP